MPATVPTASHERFGADPKVMFHRHFRQSRPTLSVVNDADLAADHPGPGAQQPGVPVFTDPSGQRRRRMRRVGVAASIFLIGALILVGIGMFGGPRTPFSLWAPQSQGHTQAGPSVRHRQHAGSGAPGHTAPWQASAPSPGPDHSPTPSPAPGSASPTSSPSDSPSPTNPAGHTPPGRNHSKKPHPSKSPHGP